MQVGIVKDDSALEPESFWIFLDHYSWVHPYDETGVRCDLKDIPDSFEKLRDVPYRSLAGKVRDTGDFSKSGAPFLEFLWANYFRAAVDSKVLAGNKKKSREARAQIGEVRQKRTVARLGGSVLKEPIMQVRDATRNPQRLLP